MFENPQIDLESLPSADAVDWQSLHPRFTTVLWIRATGFVVAIAAFLVVLTVVLDRTPAPPALLWGAAALVAAGLYAWPAVSVSRRGYVVRARDILFREGVLWRSVTAVPFNRIQHVETGSSPLDRRFGLATLSLYTAGGSGSDLRIDGLAADTAERLRRTIVDRAGDQLERA